MLTVGSYVHLVVSYTDAFDVTVLLMHPRRILRCS